MGPDRTTPAARSRERLNLRLYVAGSGPNSSAALANLRAALAALPPDAVDVVVVDVLESPDRALDDGVFVTPMLVKIAPHPERRLLGSLRDRAVLLAALGIEEARDD